MITKLRPALLLGTVLWITAFSPQLLANPPHSYSTDDKIDAASRAQVVNALADQMRDRYVFPDAGASAETMLRKKLKDGGYDTVTYASGFASVLTSDLKSVCHDLHLRVEYGDLPPEEADPNAATPTDTRGATSKPFEASGSGLGSPDILPGNIGYLDIREFLPAKNVKKAIAGAMARLAGSSALIIDLRKNDGGEPETVALISSYLFDKRTHLNDLHWRAGGRIQQFWTDEKVLGRKFAQSKPVYVLTSKHTGSAGEEFAYNLQSPMRATLVGETTWGGAHHGYSVRLTDQYYAFIPLARAVNPITKTNWEGTGVQPDVPASYQTALLVAQKLAMQALTVDEKSPQKLLALRGRLGELESQLQQPAAPVGR